ncbi:hypothetical protein IGI04_006014 [Brassica rapa subsp. trilocularis]|uniref:F-box associated domain-containing protein n=1 Tax=Brassica rapa subsp. trilocularis TaxID=1813537 RepID=A0ABQ7NFP1_BRACM|nr:hypothetical protein IGI04_006014 [Brassica rapa subsp. trilocularis]
MLSVLYHYRCLLSDSPKKDFHRCPRHPLEHWRGVICSFFTGCPGFSSSSENNGTGGYRRGPCFWISANLGDLSYDSCSSIPRKKLREEEFYLIDGWEIFTYSKEVADARKSLFIACFLKSYCASPLDFGFGSVDLRSPNCFTLSFIDIVVDGKQVVPFHPVPDHSGIVLKRVTVGQARAGCILWNECPNPSRYMYKLLWVGPRDRC